MEGFGRGMWAVACALLITGAAAADSVAQETVGSGPTLYLDLQTGAVTARPEPGRQVLTLAPREVQMLSASSEGLVSVPAPGGGATVNLGGRFRQLSFATVGENGAVESHCIAPGLEPDPPGSATDSAAPAAATVGEGTAR